MLIFDSSAAVTPVKYEHDLKILAYNFVISKYQ